MKLELIATATFGLEAVVRREIEALGYKIIKTEDGRITYMGDERAIVRSNLWLRCADRVYVRMGEFTAKTFEELFQQTKAIEWESMIPLDGAFPVVGGSVKSVLHSVPACQKIVKKAVSERLGGFYFMEQLPETGSEYRIRFIAHKDSFLMLLDTSGAGLHKRGYRTAASAAPIKETLAAALVQLSFYRRDRVLLDCCCGSGTIPIEAALIARSIAPGLNRSFASETWDLIDPAIWKQEKKKAFEAIDPELSPLRIKGIEIDRRVVHAAIENAEEAGVTDDMDFVCMDMTKWEPASAAAADSSGLGSYGREIAGSDRVVVISNLPYAIRVGTTDGNRKIYAHIKKLMEECPRWSFFLLTADKDLEKELGRKADRRRKLYNGTIETQFYQFHGERPSR